MTLEILKEHASFGGRQRVHKHRSDALGCDMQFATYVPPGLEGKRAPVLYFLSGLTCTWENFTAKAGAQRLAAKHGIVLVVPDTSPRGAGVADAEGRYDLGQGAGFYVDATREPWARNYRMYSYVTEELPAVAEASLPVDPGRRGIFGHSMGGHGALVAAFRNPDRYRSVSAFSPIVNPAGVPWGRNAFAEYLGADESAWAEHDATLLAARTAWRSPVLVDQGTADEFLAEQLRPERLEEACRSAGIPVTVNLREGYDHSYYFIATFMEDHMDHHAAALKA
jgi:S-formylglutathione hydrolase